MNFNKLVEEVALENDFNPNKVKKIALALFTKIVQKLESRETIKTPKFVFKPRKGQNSLKLGLIRKLKKNIESNEKKDD